MTTAWRHFDIKEPFGINLKKISMRSSTADEPKLSYQETAKPFPAYNKSAVDDFENILK